MQRFGWVLIGVVALPLAGVGAYGIAVRDGAAPVERAMHWWRELRGELPDGFAGGNGRIEATQLDVATKIPGRVTEVLADEGDAVEAGQVLARIDTKDSEAQLRQAEAEIERARQTRVAAQALVTQRRSELVFAEQELQRAQALHERGFASRERLDQRRAESQTASAALAAALAQIEVADRTIDAMTAAADRIRVGIADGVLTAPRSGRVLYRLAEPGEVLGVGGRVLTLLDLTDVYMTIFLPTREAGRVPLGGEARIVLDAAPQYVIPAKVSFVAARSQFTPKEVETRSERDKLMFRVKLQIAADLLRAHADRVKTGVPGVGYVRLDPQAPWPSRLTTKLP